MNDDDEIQPVPELKPVRRQDRPELPLEPIAPRRPFQSAARAQPHADPVPIVGQRADRQRQPPGPPSPSIDRGECLGPLQAGMSCQRPFRRRRLSVLRPPSDRMRWRNPCVLARLRLDLFVRCFFIASRPLYGRAAEQSRRNRLRCPWRLAIIDSLACPFDLCKTCGNCAKLSRL